MGSPSGVTTSISSMRRRNAGASAAVTTPWPQRRDQRRGAMSPRLYGTRHHLVIVVQLIGTPTLDGGRANDRTREPAHEVPGVLCMALRAPGETAASLKADILLI